MRSLVRYVRSITPVEGHGTRLSRGPNGTVISTAGDKDVRPASDAKVPGCFDVSIRINTGGQSADLTFANRYYQVAGVTFEMPSSDDPDDDVLTVTGACFVALVIDAVRGDEAGTGAEIRAFASLETLRNLQQNDSTHYVMPLYMISDAFSVICDMRTIQTAAMGEVMP